MVLVVSLMQFFKFIMFVSVFSRSVSVVSVSVSVVSVSVSVVSVAVSVVSVVPVISRTAFRVLYLPSAPLFISSRRTR